MGNISKQRTNGERSVPILSRDWVPFRGLRGWFRWDPFAELAESLSRGDETFEPSVDVKQTKDAFLFSADLPGVRESDVTVRVSQNRLTIAGKRESEKTEEDETYYAHECSFGTFNRTFMLPEDADSDNVRAELKHGVLRVTLPKYPEAHHKKILVETG